MKPRAWLFAVLLVPPVLAQETAPAPAFDLRSDAIRKIVRDTAATQYANFQESRPEPAESEPDEFEYVPPEKPPAPKAAAASEEPAQPPPPDGFVSQTLSFLIDELIGVEGSEVEIANDLLRCRVQKETKTSPPGVDNCPTAD